jgi:O-antigen/teichoic acid export membrane protein
VATRASVHRLRDSAQRAAAGGRGQVIGLALAAGTANVLALVFTVVFARALDTDGYGSLAAMISALLILAVPGSALQVAVARDVAAGRYGAGAELAAAVRGWVTGLVIAGAVAGALSLLARDLVAAAIGVEEAWAAAAVAPGAVTWVILSVARGALQGVGAIAPVAWSIAGDAFGRLICGLLLLAAGAGVTGAFLGTPLAFGIAAAILLAVLRRRLGAPAARSPHPGLGALAASAWTAIAGLTLVMFLQNVDVIMAKHRLDDDAAGAYAATAVAAKVLIWVAIGVAMYVVPEAARRAARGSPPLGALRHALLVIAGLAVPVLGLFLVAPELLLRLGFGEDYATAHRALLPLGAAMTLLACSYLAAQYLMALHHTAFLWVLGLAAVAEVVGLALAGERALTIAVIVLAVQAAGAAAVLLLAARAQPRGSLSGVAA